MADLSTVESAFLKADQVGDTDSARVLAAEIRRLRAEPPERGFLAKTISNIPSSAAKFASDLVHPILHPIDTAKNLGDIALGVGQKLVPTPQTMVGAESGISTDKEAKTAEAAGQFFKDRYGGLENIKNTVSTDPIGTAADASILLSGGGSLAARAPGIAGKMGAALQKTGQAIDPINASVNAVKGTAGMAEALGSNALGFSTGAGAQSIREAAKAGATGGAQGDAFLSQLRGDAPVNAVVDEATKAVDRMRQERSAEYKQNMGAVLQDKTALSFDPIDKAVADVKNSGIYQGKVINPSAAETWQKIDSLVADWKMSDPAKFHTPEGLDALKKAIGDVRDSSEFGTPARRVADQVYNAVKTQITTQAPAYSKAMKDYEVASDLLKEMEKTLSLNPKANVDTTVRKLQSILRNNANTNYGQRVELSKVLQEKGADTLMPQLAGQALSSPTPRSLQGIGTALSGGAASMANPMMIPALAATSPRIVGEGAYYAGKAGGNITSLVKALSEKTGISNATARALLYQVGRQGNQ